MIEHLKHSIVAFLIVCIMAPGFYLGMAPVHEAEADLSQVFAGAAGSLAACVITNLIGSAVSSAVLSVVSLLYSVPTNETSLSMLKNTWTTSSATTIQVFKDCILDALAWAAKAIIVEIILKAIVDWINEGFDGGPAFLSDFNGFFKDLAFATLDAFINESGFSDLLCEPFRDDVKNFMLKMDVRVQTKDYACTALGLVGGSEGYNKLVNDGNLNYESGGLSAAASLVRSGNNLFSAVFNVEADASSRVNKAKQQETFLLEQGDGFFSMRCDTNNDGVKEVCTPGQFVATQINNWMNGGLDMLENADEVSEVVASLVSMLVQKTLFDETKGLLADYTAKTKSEITQSWTTAGYSYSGPGEEEAYTGGTQTETTGGSSSGSTSGQVSCDNYTATPVGGSTKTITWSGAYVSVDGILQRKFQFPGLGPDYGKTIRFVFSDGSTLNVPNSCNMYIGDAQTAIKYQPGYPLSSNSDITSMEVYAPRGSSPTSVTAYY